MVYFTLLGHFLDISPDSDTHPRANKLPPNL